MSIHHLIKEAETKCRFSLGRAAVRRSLCLFVTFALLALSNCVARAATITWTNASGGNWNVAANWSPNQVPGSSDNVLITANGTYTVTLNASPTIASLALGGDSGNQTLNTSGNNLTKQRQHRQWERHPGPE